MQDIPHFKYDHAVRTAIPVFLSLLLLLPPACGKRTKDADRIEALVQEEVDKRIEHYRQLVGERCRENILKEASRIVDSILIIEARLTRDTLRKPPKPEKPERPEVRPPKDSLAVRPLLSPKKDSTKRKNGMSE